MILDSIINQITEEVEARILKNLESLKFNIEVTVSKGEKKDDEDEEV